MNETHTLSLKAYNCRNEYDVEGWRMNMDGMNMIMMISHLEMFGESGRNEGFRPHPAKITLDVCHR